MTMTFHAFMSRMLKPTYVWRMATGKDDGSDRPRARGARTTMSRAQRQIDDLVLQRAQVIADERRCTAIKLRYRSESRPYLIRCEFHRDHDKVGPGINDSRTSHVTARRDWDHGAPSAGTWWMNDTTTKEDS